MADAEIRVRKRDRLKARAKRYVDLPLSLRTADLPRRAASAVAMLAIAGTAVALGGLVLDGFIALVALVCLGEFVLLVLRATRKWAARAAAICAGAAYVGLAGFVLATMAPWNVIGVVGAVICVDVFAYFFGRTIGGPKIAPSISPSKTWAGLLGGVIGVSVFFVVYGYWAPWLCEAFTAPDAYATAFAFDDRCHFGPNPDFLRHLLSASALGLVVAPVAQAGDFFESWLKRRAGKKDSSNLIPGHGGVFDRVDGLLPVALLVGALGLLS